jgi:hypothetical protein
MPVETEEAESLLSEAMRPLAIAAALLVALAGCGGGGDDSGRVDVLGPDGEKATVTNPCSIVTEAEVISIFGSTGPAVQSSSNCHWGGNGPETTLRVFVRVPSFGSDVDERRDWFADNDSVAAKDIPDLGDDATLLVGTRRYESGGDEVVEVDAVVFQVGDERVELQTGVAYHFAPGSTEAEQMIAVARSAADRMAAADSP